MAAAAKGLQEMGAERFVQAMATAAATSVAAAVGSSHGQQCTSSIAVQAPQMRLHEAYLLKVVQLLHQSGQGCMLFADELELYLRAEGSAAGARVNLLLGAAQGPQRVAYVVQCGLRFPKPVHPSGCCPVRALRYVSGYQGKDSDVQPPHVGSRNLAIWRTSLPPS